MTILDYLRAPNPYYNADDWVLIEKEYPAIMPYWRATPARSIKENEQELKELILHWNTEL